MAGILGVLDACMEQIVEVAILLLPVCQFAGKNDTGAPSRPRAAPSAD